MLLTPMKKEKGCKDFRAGRARAITYKPQGPALVHRLSSRRATRARRDSRDLFKSPAFVEERTGTPLSVRCPGLLPRGCVAPGISREETRGMFRDDVDGNVLLANQSFYVMKVFTI